MFFEILLMITRVEQFRIFYEHLIIFCQHLPTVDVLPVLFPIPLFNHDTLVCSYRRVQTCPTGQRWTWDVLCRCWLWNTPLFLKWELFSIVLQQPSFYLQVAQTLSFLLGSYFTAQDDFQKPVRSREVDGFLKNSEVLVFQLSTPRYRTKSETLAGGPGKLTVCQVLSYSSS